MLKFEAQKAQFFCTNFMSKACGWGVVEIDFFQNMQKKFSLLA